MSFQFKENFDELNHRYSDLLVSSSLVLEDAITDDSDNLFKDIKTCKNVTFSRSRSCFDDGLELFPITPVRAIDKHPLLTSDEEEYSVQSDHNELSLSNNSSNVYRPRPNAIRSPLKSFTSNHSTTPQLAEKSGPRNLSSSLYFSEFKPDHTHLNNKPNVLTPDNGNINKENLNTRSIILSPVTTPTGISGLTLGDLSCKNPTGMQRTPLNKTAKTVSQTPTPFSKALTLSTVLRTPVSCETTPKLKPPMSVLKRQSIDKAVASAKREFKEMTKNIKLRKSILKAKQKERNISILDGHSDSPSSSTAPNKLDNTPTNAVKTCRGSVKTPLSGKAETGCPLTGVKKLDLQDNRKKQVSNHLSLNLINTINKDKSLLSEDDDSDLIPTQPLTTILLRNVVAYVEVRCGRDYLSEGTKAELESLGAKVEKNFTRKVTHCFFHGGRMSTYRKAIEWKVPLVSTLWIEACKAELQMLPLKGFAPHGLEKYREALPLYKLKTKGLRRAVTDSKIRRKPWKDDDLNKKATQAVPNKLLPPVPTFKEANKIIDALHSVAGDLRKATDQFDKILTSPVLKKKGEEKAKDGIRTSADQQTNTSNCRKKRNKKLVFGGSSDDDNKENKDNTAINETTETCSKISDINDSEIRVSYDSDDLLVYAKKQALNTRNSAPSRLLTCRKYKKQLSSCKEPEKKNKPSIPTTSSTVIQRNEHVDSNSSKSRPARKSKSQPKNAEKINAKGSSPKHQIKRRKLLLLSQVIADFEQDSGESTPPASPRCPYKVTPNKKPRNGLAVKRNTVRTLGSAKVLSDCESEDSVSRAARRESSALFIKKENKVNPQKTVPTIVCTSLGRSDEDVVKSVVAQLGTFAVEAVVSERTTHVLTPAPRRTINLLKGIARGCWVLNVQWVYKSLEVGQWLPEERFELTEFSPAVKLARCDRQAFGPEFGLELFTGLGPFYVCRATVPPSRDLVELLRLGGGIVVSNARAAKIVIGSTLPLSPCGRTPPLMVKEKWILDCITRLTKLSVQDYIAVVDTEP